MSAGMLPSWSQRHRLGLIAHERALGAPFHNYVTRVVRVSGPLDVERLNDAWRSVQRRHPLTRTGFDSGLWTAPCADLRDLVVCVSSEGRRRDPVKGLVDDLLAPMELAEGGLARLCVAAEGDGSHLVGIAMEHLISDGWTIGLLERDLWRVYRHEPAVAESVTGTDFRSIVRREHRYLASDDGRRALERRCLALRDVGPMPALDVPYPQPGTVADQRPRHVTVVLADEAFGRLRHIGSRHGLSVVSVALAAMLAACHQLTGAEKVAAGTMLANRSHPALVETVGWLSDEVIVASDRRSGLSADSFLPHFAESYAEAVDASDTPSGAIVDRMAPELFGVPCPFRRIVFNPMPRSMRVRFPRPDVVGLTMTPVSHSTSWVGDEIHVQASDVRSLVLRIFYKPQAVDSRSIADLRDQVEQVLTEWAQ
jgi:hypothetical protein